MDTKNFQEFQQAMAEVDKAILAGQDKEKITKGIDEIAKKYPVKRKGDFSVDVPAGDILTFGNPKDLIVKSAGKNEQLKDFQDWQDSVFILNALATHENKNFDIRSSRFYQLGKAKHAPMIKSINKALSSTTSGSGDEWVPTRFSAELIDLVRLERKVAALHRTIDMPSNPYTYPALGGDLTPYLVGENTANTGTKITASTITTANRTFTAKKIGVRTLFSEEVDEDSIIPIIGETKKDLANAMSLAEEDGAINGDTTEPHMDSDVDTATDYRKAWNGFRDCTLAAAKLDASGTGFNETKCRTLSAVMGKYAANPAKCYWLASSQSYASLRGFSDLISIEKFGLKAPIVTGHVGFFEGSPVIVSEYVRSNLATTGLYDGTTTNNTMFLYIYRPGFWYGDKRKVTVKTKDDIETDQIIMVVTMRKAFRAVYDTTSEKIVGYIFNIDNLS